MLINTFGGSIMNTSSRRVGFILLNSGGEQHRHCHCGRTANVITSTEKKMYYPPHTVFRIYIGDLNRLV